MNNRRKLLHALAAYTLAVPILVPAQPQRFWRVGVLNVGRDDEAFDALRGGMRELGYSEGKNVRYELRHGGDSYERVPVLASELVALKVDVIVVGGTVSTRAAQHATKLIPIVMVGVGDPIGQGFITSLARPGGNITGLSNVATELIAKRLELLLMAVPRVARVASLRNPDNPNPVAQQYLLDGAKKLNVSILSLTARNPKEIDQAFVEALRERVEALIVQGDNLYNVHRQRIVTAAEKARLPAIYTQRWFVESGGFMSYGINHREIYRKAATHVHKILIGVKPSELPVEQPTTFDLAINMKTAKALGLTIPPELLVRADRVVE